MKTSSWLRWCKSLRSAKQRGRIRAQGAGGSPRVWRRSRTASRCRLTPHMVLDINPNAAVLEPVATSWRSARRPTSPPTTASTGTSCGRATAPPPAPSWSRTSTPAAASSYPGNLTNVNGTLFFAANDGTHGYELWKSDGTAAGTVLVKDINPGSGDSYARPQPDERERHAVLRGQRRHARRGAVEERRHGRRHRPGQGHQPRQRRQLRSSTT